MKKSKNIKTDIILIVALLAAGVIFAAVILLGGKHGSHVAIKVDGQIVKELPLNVNTEYVIKGEGGINVLVIENGAVWISEADCPDGLCRNMGKISRAGQSLICLPHKVVAEIMQGEGQETQDIDIYVK